MGTLAWVAASAALVILGLNARSLPLVHHFRLFLGLLQGIRQGRLPSITSEDEWTTRVMVDDMDHNLHMNNSSYPRLTDFARYKFFARLLGGFSQLKTVRIFNGGVGFQFIKEIHLFDSIKFTSRVVGHDRKWVFIRHVISRGKTVCAVGITKIVLKEPSGKTIPPAIAFKMCGYTDVETMAGASAVAAGRALSTTHIPVADRIDTLQSEAGDDWLSMESNLNPAAKM